MLVTVASQAAIAVQNAAIHESLLEGDPLQCDAKLAEHIRRLMPQSVPVVPGFEFFAHYNPAHEIHGDYYDFVRLSCHRFAVAVGDVSGTGGRRAHDRQALVQYALLHLHRELPGQRRQRAEQPDVLRGRRGEVDQFEPQCASMCQREPSP